MVRRASKRGRCAFCKIAGLAALVLAVQRASAQTNGSDVLEALEKSLTQLAAQILPAVVQVRVERESPQPAAAQGEEEAPRGQQEIPEFFRRFFEQPPLGPGLAPQPEEPPVQGSGIVFRPDGYILTNAHVVKDAKKIEIRFVQPRRIRMAEVVGVDNRMDIAVLKVATNGTPLPTVKLGDSDAVRIGQLVLAVGSPFEFEATITLGIVSAQDRSIWDPGGREFQYRHLLQTDAAINPGNSGGPLVNMRGEVIGISNAIYTPTLRGNIGIGFAIPINRVKNRLDMLIEQGTVPRGYLGVAVGEANDDALRELYGVEGGAWVREVRPNTPAEQAGIQVGDLIVELDGQPIRSSGDLVDIVADLPAGPEVTLKLLRWGDERGQVETREVTLRLAPLPAELGGAGVRPVPQPTARDKLGLVVAPLPEELRQTVGAPAEGVLVQRVLPDSPASEAGIVPGLVVVRIWHRGGDNVIRNLADYERALQAIADAKAVSLQAWARVRDQWVKRSYILALPRPGE